MMQVCSIVAWWIVAAFLVCPCVGASNDLERLVHSFPDVAASRYRPDLAAQAANQFILAGEKASFEVLSRLATPRHDLSGPEKLTEFKAFEDDNRKICFLSRLLYMPKPGAAPLQPPRMGQPVHLPYESMDLLSWPHLPFVVTNGIPLSMNLGYGLLGLSERAHSYLAYCQSNGTFRAELFAQPAPESATRAIQQVFESAAWKRLRWKDSGPYWQYDLQESEAKRMLWLQVTNMTSKPATH